MTTRKAILAAILVGWVASAVQALGRKPDDDDKDNFPDYNRIEMRPKPKPPQPPPPAESEKPALPPAPPSLNTPTNPGEDDTVPKPPPKAVPLPADSSEPAMPDDLIDTGTSPPTGQAPAGNPK